MRPDPYWQLVGTFWPVIGLALIAIAATITHGSARWWILYLGPVTAVAPCYFFAEAIAYDGNMLFAVIFLLTVIGLMIYYPALIIITIIIWSRKTNQTSQSSP